MVIVFHQPMWRSEDNETSSRCLKEKKKVKLEFYIYISFRSEGKIKSFSDVGELRNVATNRPAT